MAEAYVTNRLVRGIANRGWQVRAFSVDPESSCEAVDERFDPPGSPNVSVRRSRSPERRLFGWAKTRWIERIARHTLCLLGLPEKQYPWIWTALHRGVSEAREFAPDVIYSRANYNVSNVLGMQLARITGVPSMAHFSDPWIGNPYLRSWPLQNLRIRSLERAIVNSARLVTVPCEEIANMFRRRYAALPPSKFVVLPHSFDEARSGPPERARATRCRIVYAGALHGSRTPQPLFEALGLLAGEPSQSWKLLEILLVGPGVRSFRRQCARPPLNGTVTLVDRVPLAECTGLLASADVCLVIDAANSASPFLPSKLIDYLAYNRPILGITSSGSPSSQLLSRLGCLSADPQDIPGIAHAMETVAQMWRDNTLEVGPAFRRNAASFTTSEVSRELDRLLRITAAKEI
jgi:hypothetical protein